MGAALPRFKIAHVKEQGIDLVIVPVANDFEHKTESERSQVVELLQAKATSAGLVGAVVLVWDSGAGQMGFRAPPSYYAYFRSISLPVVWAKLNRELFW